MMMDLDWVDLFTKLGLLPAMLVALLVGLYRIITRIMTAHDKSFERLLTALEQLVNKVDSRMGKVESQNDDILHLQQSLKVELDTIKSRFSINGKG